MKPNSAFMRAVLLGPPNSGKGVACEFLTQTADIKCVSTGQLLRAEVAAETPIGLMLKPELEKGHFAPDEVVQRLVAVFLKENDSFALDGFPRNTPQAEFLNNELDRLGKPLNIVIHLTASDDVIIERAVTRLTCDKCRKVTSTRHTDSKICSCGGNLFRRADDTEAVVKERLEIYREQTEPLLDFYRGMGIIEEVEAGGSIPDLHDKLTLVLKRLGYNL